MIDITYTNINSGKEWQSQLNENQRKLREKFLSEDWSQIPITCQHCLVKQLKNKDN